VYSVRCKKGKSRDRREVLVQESRHCLKVR
jgi:hypothetical protein